MHAIRGFKADSKPARKLTPARIVKALRAGARLCAHQGAKITYSLQPPGVRVPVKYGRSAIRSGEASLRLTSLVSSLLRVGKPRRKSIEELNALLDALDPENASAVRRASNNSQ